MAGSAKSKDANLVTRMLRSINVGNEDYDFDDVLRRFERRFGATYTSENKNEGDDSDTSVKDHASSAGDIETETESLIPISIEDFTDEFAAFFATFCRVVHSRAKMESNCDINADDQSVHISKSAYEVSRQVLRRELHHYTDRLAEVDVFLSEAQGSGVVLGLRSTVASLKRQVREANENLERAARVSKRRDVENRKLKEQFKEVHDERERMETERQAESEENERLHTRMLSIKRLIEESTHENQHLYYQKQRLERSIGVLRKELLETHLDRDSIRLELDMLKSRSEELARRNEEASKGESLIVAKVRELQELQQEMLEHMSQIGHGNLRARGALDALATKRNRLLGRIAALIEKRGDASSTPSPAAPSAATVSGASPSGATASAVSPSARARDSSAGPLDKTSTFPGGFTASASTSGAERPPDRARNDGALGVLQRKMTRMMRPLSLNSAGTTHTERDSDREHRAALRYAGARAHGAAISDLAALREVIEMREKEIERMGNELTKTRGRADGFERELYAVRQGKRKENRNLGGAELVQALELMHKDRENHDLHNTMFDWADNPAPGDGEHVAKVPPALDTAPLSPVSEHGDMSRIDSTVPDFRQ